MTPVSSEPICEARRMRCTRRRERGARPIERQIGEAHVEKEAQAIADLLQELAATTLSLADQRSVSMKCAAASMVMRETFDDALLVDAHGAALLPQPLAVQAEQALSEK